MAWDRCWSSWSVLILKTDRSEEAAAHRCLSALTTCTKNHGLVACLRKVAYECVRSVRQQNARQSAPRSHSANFSVGERVTRSEVLDPQFPSSVASVFAAASRRRVRSSPD